MAAFAGKLFSRTTKASFSLSPASSRSLSSVLVESYYNEEQKEMQSTLRKIIDKEINPHTDKWEREQMWPGHEVIKKLGNAGFLGVNKPVEYGGLGLDYKYQLAVLETAGHIRSGGVGMGIGVHTDCATPALARFGSDELRRQFLAPAIAGDQLSCIGVSEPGGGSDVAALKTRAVRKGDDWIINGQKMWITNSLQADWMCLLANTSDEGKAHENKSLIIVPLDSPGVVKAKKISKIGMHSSDTGLIYFEDVRVPCKYTIGEEGMGFIYQMMQFQEERLAGAVGCLVPLETAIAETLEYCRERTAFGKPLLDNQYIHYRLAELQSDVELFRGSVYAATDALLAGENITLLASMLKLKAGRMSREVPDACLQFWGGMGFTNEVYVSRLYRDLRLWSIGGGADEVMLAIICKYMGSLPSKKKK